MSTDLNCFSIIQNMHSKYRIIGDSKAMPPAGPFLAIAPMFSELRGEVLEGSQAVNENSLQEEPGAGKVHGPGGPSFSPLAPMGKSETSRKVTVISDIHRLYKETQSSENWKR